MKKNLPLSVIIVSLLISCVSVQKIDNVDSSVSEDEGWLVFRIINPTAGMNLPYYRGDKELQIKPFELNSDVDFGVVTGVFAFSHFVIQNNEAPVQLVKIRKKQGKYILYQIGKKSKYIGSNRLKPFSVKSGTVNYLGDLYVDLVQGKLGIGVSPNDWYTIRIEDNFDELMDSFRKYGYFDEDGAFAGLEAINICTPTNGTLQPDNCPVR